jgi:beta-N-acetylhexosaminidase
VRSILGAGIVTVGALCALLGCGGVAGKAPAASTTAPSVSVVSTPAIAAAATAPTAAASTSSRGPDSEARQATSPPPTTPPASESPAASEIPAAILRPPIHQWPIPYGAARRRQMAAYSQRHYGEDTYLLSDPKVIVEHYTETDTAQEAFNTFAPDVPDNEFHELPNTCAHFLVEASGRLDQLVALSLRCRHTTGLNWTAIGIENVGLSDREILDNPRQMAASVSLTEWLRCRYAIALKNVIGHNESLSSPYHHDRVPAFQHQTHSDWNHADMDRYRALLARRPCPQTPSEGVPAQ